MATNVKIAFSNSLSLCFHLVSSDSEISTYFCIGFFKSSRDKGLENRIERRTFCYILVKLDSGISKKRSFRAIEPNWLVAKEAVHKRRLFSFEQTKNNKLACKCQFQIRITMKNVG